MFINPQDLLSALSALDKPEKALRALYTEDPTNVKIKANLDELEKIREDILEAACDSCGEEECEEEMCDEDDDELMAVDECDVGDMSEEEEEVIAVLKTTAKNLYAEADAMDMPYSEDDLDVDFMEDELAENDEMAMCGEDSSEEELSRKLDDLNEAADDNQSSDIELPMLDDAELPMDDDSTSVDALSIEDELEALEDGDDEEFEEEILEARLVLAKSKLKATHDFKAGQCEDDPLDNVSDDKFSDDYMPEGIPDEDDADDADEINLDQDELSARVRGILANFSPKTIKRTRTKSRKVDDVEKTLGKLKALAEQLTADIGATEYADSDNTVNAKRIPKSVFRERKGKISKVKRWLSATRPTKSRSKKGNFSWTSRLKYLHKNGSTRSITRVVGKDPKNKPTEVVMDGKKLRWSN